MKKKNISVVNPHLWRSIWLTACVCLLLTCSSVLAQTVKPEDLSADCRVKAYGAKGDGITLDTVAINAAIEDCHSRGGGTVVIDAGTYRSGTIHLLDNITLKLSPGSRVLGS